MMFHYAADQIRWAAGRITVAMLCRLRGHKWARRPRHNTPYRRRYYAVKLVPDAG